jgi:hypothetical protein
MTWILEFENGSTVKCGSFAEVIEFLEKRARLIEKEAQHE